MPPKLPLSAYRSIGEVSVLLDIPQHVLKFWEARFEELRPLRRGRGDRARRLYGPEDIALLKGIRFMLRDQGLNVRGVQRAFRDGGVTAVRDRAAMPPVQPDVALVPAA